MKRLIWLAVLGGLTAVLYQLSQTPAGASGPVIHLTTAQFDPLAGQPAVPAPLRASAASRYALLQLDAPPNATTTAALLSSGLVFYDYIPQHAYLVRLPAGGMEAAGALPGVRWVGAYHPAYKLSPAATGGRLTLDLYPNADAGAAATAVARLGARVLEVVSGERVRLLRVEADAALLPVLAAIDDVRWIQNAPALREYNDDARWVTQSDLRDVPSLYAHGLTGAGQVGALADSGLAVYDFTGPGNTSCYFSDDGNGGAGGAAQMPGVSHRKVITYTIPAGAGGDMVDGSGHGSHTTGSVAGDGPPWNALSSGDGMAYEARIFFQDIGTGSPVGTINPPADFGIMFGQAYDGNGDGLYQPLLEPRTHSNSYGDPTPIYSAESAQTDDFMWLHPDFLILFAAGNQGPTPSTVGWPGTAKNIVTVGATENGLADTENMMFQSSHGPAPIDRLKPEVSAPGDRVESALNTDPCATVTKNGTSMAAPVVQGVALQMRQYLTDGFYPSGTAVPADAIHPSAALLKALLMNSGRPMSGNHSDNAAGGSWPSNGQGWGRATAEDALYFQGDHRALWLYDEYALDGSAGLTLADPTRTFTFTVADGAPLTAEPLEVTLAWTDHSGSPAASGALVNDIHLTVTDPSGGVHAGNDPLSNDFIGLPDLPPASPDVVNPWETVYLAAPGPGVYTATVTLASYGSVLLDPGRKQGFALVATGDLLSRAGRAEIEYPFYDVNGAPLTAVLRLTDLDLNGDPAAVETATAVLTSTTDATGVMVTLTETAANSAVFVGAVTLTDTPPSAGELAVAQGDVVRLSYQDADDGRGGSGEAWDTVVIAPRPANLVNPPDLADPGDSDNDGNFTLTWAAPEDTSGLIGYAVQEAVDFTRPLFDDAEGAIADNWTTGQLTSPWMKDSTYQQSGLSAFWSGRGDALPLVDTSLTLDHDVTIPATAASARLTFFSRYFNDINDYGHIEISTDGGSSWTELLFLYADPRLPPADTRLQFHSVDLSGYAGMPLRVRFRYDNGIVSVPPDSPGWWLDDIGVSGATWRTIGLTNGATTSLAVTGRAPGGYAYRVQAWYDDGAATAWSGAEEITVVVPTAVTGSQASAGGGTAVGWWLLAGLLMAGMAILRWTVLTRQ